MESGVFSSRSRLSNVDGLFFRMVTTPGQGQHRVFLMAMTAGWGQNRVVGSNGGDDMSMTIRLFSNSIR